VTLDFTDIIGLHYAAGGTDPATGVDCLWAARRGLERIFPDLRPDELPILAEEQAARLALARQGMDSWVRIGESVFAATRVGDILVGEHANGGLSIGVLVNVERREILTAVPDVGVVLQPVRRFVIVRDVFRRGA